VLLGITGSADQYRWQLPTWFLHSNCASIYSKSTPQNTSPLILAIPQHIQLALFKSASYFLFNASSAKEIHPRHNSVWRWWWGQY